MFSKLLQRESAGGQPSAVPRFRRYISSKGDLVERLERQCVLRGHNGCVNTASFTPSGEALLSGSDDHLIILWDWQTGQKKLRYQSGHRNNVFQARALPFSDDSTVVSCAADGQVRVGHVSEGGQVETQRLATHSGRAHKLALEPESLQCFLSCGEDGAVCMESKTSDMWVEIRGTISNSAGMQVRHFDLRHAPPSNKRLLVCRANAPVRRSVAYSEAIELNSIHCNPSRPWQFVVAGSDETVRVYDRRRASGAASLAHPVRKLAPEHMRTSRRRGPVHVTCAMFSSTGEIVATYNDDDIYLFAAEQQGAGRPQPNRANSPSKRARTDASAAAPFASSAPSAAPQPAPCVADAVFFASRAAASSAAAAPDEAPDDQEGTDAGLPAPAAAGADSGAAAAGRSSRSGGSPSAPPDGPAASRSAGASSAHPSAAQRDTLSDAPAFAPASGGGADCAAHAERVMRSPPEPDGNLGDAPSPGHPLCQAAAAESPEDEAAASAEVHEEPPPPPPGDPPSSLSGSRRPTDVADPWDDDSDAAAPPPPVTRRRRRNAFLLPEGLLRRGGIVDDSSEDDEQEPQPEAEDEAAGNSTSDEVLQRYTGHRNAQTVKGVAFAGASDEFIMSGSDCGHLFIWDKIGGRLRACHEGDANVVNCLEQHPTLPLTIATSGIDDDIKIWAPTADVAQKIGRSTERVMQRNAAGRSEGRSLRQVVITPRMLQQLLMLHGGMGFATIVSDEDDDDDDEQELQDSDSDEEAGPPAVEAAEWETDDEQ